MPDEIHPKKIHSVTSNAILVIVGANLCTLLGFIFYAGAAVGQIRTIPDLQKAIIETNIRVSVLETKFNSIDWKLDSLGSTLKEHDDRDRLRDR